MKSALELSIFHPNTTAAALKLSTMTALDLPNLFLLSGSGVYVISTAKSRFTIRHHPLPVLNPREFASQALWEYLSETWGFVEIVHPPQLFAHLSLQENPSLGVLASMKNCHMVNATEHWQ